MGLFKTGAKVAVASSVAGRVQRRQQQRWAQQDAAAAAPAPAAAAPAPAAAAPAPAAAAPVPAAAPPALDGPHGLMQALTQLRTAGVVSDAEFAEISSRIFG